MNYIVDVSFAVVNQDVFTPLNEMSEATYSSVGNDKGLFILNPELENLYEIDIVGPKFTTEKFPTFFTLEGYKPLKIG